VTIIELCQDLPKGALRTRMVNALHAEGVDTVADLDAFLDRHGFLLHGHGKLYRFARLRWVVPNFGDKSVRTLKALLLQKAPQVLDEAKEVA
jgi:hypothetical protein